MPIEHINRTDSLNKGRTKINNAIDGSNKAVNDAAGALARSLSAEQISLLSQAMSQQTQNQLDNIIIESGTSDAEVIQARKDYPVLNARLDASDTQLTDTANKKTEGSKTLYSGGKERKAQVSIITDDGSIQELTRVKPICDSHGVKYGTGIITSTVGTSGFMTWDQIRSMKKEGHDVLCHSHQHLDFATMTEYEMTEDLATATRLMNENGLYPSGFVYPLNSHNPATRKIISRFFLYAFAKTRGPFSEITRNFPYMLNQAIARMAVGSFFDNQIAGFPTDTKSLEYYKSRVDEAIANKNWLVLVLHPWHSDHTETQQQYFSQLIDYIKSKGIDIVTPSEGFNTYGNVIDVADAKGINKFRIDADGNMEGLKEYVVYEEYNTRTTAEPYSNFPKQAKTVTPYTRSAAEADKGLPSDYEGKLITERVSSNTFDTKQTYEEFVANMPTNRRARTFERHVNPDGSWTAFKVPGEMFYDVISSPVTISANSTKDIELPADRVLLQDVVTVMPFNAAQVPVGVIYTLLQTNSNKVILRLANVTTSQKPVGEIRWAITVKPKMNF